MARNTQRSLWRRAGAWLAARGLVGARAAARSRAEARQERRDEDRQAERDRLAAQGYDRRDVSPRGLLYLALAAAAVGGLLGLALLGMFALFVSAPVPAVGQASAFEQTAELPPQPRLQAAPRQDLLEYRATEAALLHGAGESPAGGRRIPIDAAMAYLAERGLGAQATPGAGGDIAAGQQLFTSLGCVGCHQMSGQGVGPPLQRVFGGQVRLESGQTVTADADYIRHSILAPKDQIVAGYPPAMPSFAGRVSDAELAQLVAYIQSLADAGGQGVAP